MSVPIHDIKHLPEFALHLWLLHYKTQASSAWPTAVDVEQIYLTSNSVDLNHVIVLLRSHTAPGQDRNLEIVSAQYLGLTYSGNSHRIAGNSPQLP